MPAHAPQALKLERDLLDRLAAAEEELVALRSELEHHQRLALLGTLAAGIAHETNNLLTPVLAYAQLAESHPDDIELLHKLKDRCASGVRPASEIANAVLNFATPRQGASRAMISSVISDALVCLARDPSKDGIDLQVICEDTLEAAISPVALQQVILNLVLNAVSVIRRQRQAKLSIQARKCQESCEICVQDNGPGLPESVQSHLFEPFTVSRETQGSGLGLWVCRMLVEQAGGTIEARQADGGGTMFTITLPLVNQAATPHPQD